MNNRSLNPFDPVQKDIIPPEVIVVGIAVFVNREKVVIASNVGLKSDVGILSADGLDSITILH